MDIWEISQGRVRFKINARQILWVRKDDDAKSIAIHMTGASQPMTLHGTEADVFWNELRADKRMS